MAILTFEEDKHLYQLDGVTIPSVTQVIKGAGLIDLSFVKKDLLEYKADIGTKVHLTTEYHDNDNLDIESLHPMLRGFLNAWILFRNQSGFKPIATERRLYHPIYRYAGTIDRIGTIANKICQLDIKTGVAHHSYAIQSAAYTELYNYNKKKAEIVKRRLSVHLKEDGTYTLVEYPDKDYNKHLKVFLAALTITNYMRNPK